MKRIMKIRNFIIALMVMFTFSAVTLNAGNKKKHSDTAHKKATPADLKVERTDEQNIKLSWNSVDEAEKYKIYRAELSQEELHKHVKKSDMHKEKKMTKAHKTYTLSAEYIKEDQVNFRQIGTTENTEFVDRTVQVALRTSGSNEMAMTEAARGPNPAGDMSSNHSVFLYRVGSVDGQGVENSKSDIALVNFAQMQKDKTKSKSKY